MWFIIIAIFHGENQDFTLEIRFPNFWGYQDITIPPSGPEAMGR